MDLRKQLNVNFGLEAFSICNLGAVNGLDLGFLNLVKSFQIVQNDQNAVHRWIHRLCPRLHHATEFETGLDGTNRVSGLVHTLRDRASESQDVSGIRFTAGHRCRQIQAVHPFRSEWLQTWHPKKNWL